MPKTLLLADDSVTIQKVVGITFANEDIELVTVDNGTDGLMRTREIRPDLVLADVAMPGMNGYELCAAIKSNPDLAHIPVLLLTGTFESYNRAKAEDAGANGHISKPFEAQALIDQVNALLAEAPRPAAHEAPAAPAPSFAHDRAPGAAGATSPSSGYDRFAVPLPSADETRVLEPPLAVPGAAPEAAPDEDDDWSTVPGTDSAEAPDAFGFDNLPGDEPATLDESGTTSGFIDPLAELEEPGEFPAARPVARESGAETSEEWLAERLPRSRAPMQPEEPAIEQVPPAMAAPSSEPSRSHVPGPAPSGDAEAAPGPPETWLATPPREELRRDAPPATPEQLDAAAGMERPYSVAPRETAVEEALRRAAAASEPTPSPEAPPAAEPPAAARLEAPGPERHDVLRPEPARPDWQPARHEGPALREEPAPVPDDLEPEGKAPAMARPDDSGALVSPAPPQSDMEWTLTEEAPAADPLAPGAAAQTDLDALTDEDLPWVEPEAAEVLDDASEELHARAEEPAEMPSAPPAPPPSPRTAIPPIDPETVKEELEKVAWEAFGNMSEQIVREVVRRVEQIAWEVVPQLTERLIRQEIEHLKAEDPED